MVISIPQLVTRFRQTARKFFCSPEAESASSEAEPEIHSSWGELSSPDETMKKNAYSKNEFAREMKYKLAGLPSAFVKDEKHGQCLKFDRLVFLIDNLNIAGVQYFFRSRCIFVQEVGPLSIVPNAQTTITFDLAGEGRIPFMLS